MKTNARLLIFCSITFSVPAMAQSFLPDGYEIEQQYGSQVSAPVARPMTAPAQPAAPAVALGTTQLAKSLYTARSNQTLWTGSPRNNARVRQFMTFLPSIRRHGLYPQDYNFSRILQLQAIDAASFENQFTVEVLRLLKDVSVGRVDPRQVATDIKFRPRAFNDVTRANQFLESLNSATFDALAPQSTPYRELLPFLARLQQASRNEVIITKTSTPLRLGVSDPVVSQIKDRLRLFGYSNLNSSSMFDESLEDAIRDIEEVNLFKPTGAITNRDVTVWGYFQAPLSDRILAVELMLEKLRWLPRELGDKYIVVNLATQQISVTDPSLSSISPIKMQKVINGRLERKTPSMIDRVTDVILNPQWNVPPGIFAKDKVPAMKAAFTNGGVEGVVNYLYQMRFNLVDPNDRKIAIDPYYIDWANLDPNSAPFMIVQDSGTDNALGVLKVNLGNPYNIYIHDTNERGLFARFRRLLSSGCIRIEHPLEFAAYLLEGTPYSLDVIERSVSTPSEVKETKWIKIPLANKLPVYILTQTAFARDGRLNFAQDSYEHNKKLQRLLSRNGYMRSEDSGLTAP